MIVSKIRILLTEDFLEPIIEECATNPADHNKLGIFLLATGRM